MSSAAVISELALLCSRFGGGAAGAKRRLLRRIGALRPISSASLRKLHDLLCFLRAYPDDDQLQHLVLRIIAGLRERLAESALDLDSPALQGTGLPGTSTSDAFCLPLLSRMLTRLPGCLEIDWEAYDVDEQEPLVNALGLLVTSGECQGLDDISLGFPEWFARCRAGSQRSDLQFLLDLFDLGRLEPALRDCLFEGLRLPVRYRLDLPGSARSELYWPVERTCFQRAPLDRKRQSLKAVLRRPFASRRRLSAARGEEFIHLAQRALCCRGLEIRTLSYASADDVTLLDCGRGFLIGLVGVVPEYRDPLECHYCCLVLKNGVPVAYGPGTISLGCCEIGLNLFPEYRGAEVRYLYPQFMRVLTQLLGARYFFLTPYGMGEGNPAALRTGAFWFYRKLGFRAANPEVERLAREQEARMRREPGYRCDAGMLRRLSHTSVFLDLSGGARRPLPLGRIGLQQSRFVSEQFRGDRRRAERECVRRVARVLGQSRIQKLPPGPRRAFTILAPILASLPDLGDWSVSEHSRLAAILAAKGAPSERPVDRMICAHSKLFRGLSELGAAPYFGAE